MFLMVSSVLATMTMGSYFFMWIFIEITVFFTIPIMANSSHSSFNTESLIIYFIYQALASIFIITGIVQGLGDYLSILISLGILVKLGVFPFHVWVLPVLKGCSYSVFFLLLIPIKLPIYLLSQFFIGSLMVLVIFTIMVGVMLAMNQSSLLGVIAASSISSTGVLLVGINVDVFLFYFVGYTLSIMVLLYGMSTKNNMLLFFSILSLLGLPLLPLFIPKLMLLLSSSLILPFFAGFILVSFMISSLYYVKFLPGSMVSFNSKNSSIILSVMLFSFLPLL